MADYAVKFRNTAANLVTIKSYHKWRGVIIPKSNITNITENITTVKRVKEFLNSYIEVLLNNTQLRDYDINYKYSFTSNTYSNKFYSEILLLIKESKYELLNMLVDSIIIAGYFGCGYSTVFTESTNIDELMGGMSCDKFQLGALDFKPIFYHKHDFKLSKPLFKLHNNIRDYLTKKKLITLLSICYPGVNFVLTNDKKSYPANYEHVDKGCLTYSMLGGVAEKRTMVTHKIESHTINIFKPFNWIKNNISMFIMIVEHEYAHYINYSLGNTFDSDIYSDTESDLLLEGELYPLVREIIAEIILTHSILDVDVMIKYSWTQICELSSVAKVINNASVKYNKHFIQKNIMSMIVDELSYINNYI